MRAGSITTNPVASAAGHLSGITMTERPVHIACINGASVRFFRPPTADGARMPWVALLDMASAAGMADMVATARAMGKEALLISAFPGNARDVDTLSGRVAIVSQRDAADL